MDLLTDLVALSLAPVACGREIGERLRSGHDPAEILGTIVTSPDYPPEMLRERAARARHAAAELNLRLVAWTDSSYPAALAAIPDPPPVLWVRGDVVALDGPAVAIVGSRAATPYALSVSERLAADLAAAGLVVVSGMARGVDAAAHRGALAGGGRTVGVLGCGADVVYPAEHRQLAVEIAGTGALATEFPPGAAPEPWHFPRRNRIISGLCRAVVVVEAGERSGSLITAKAALDHGREVLAVPGNILTGRNRGTHALLRDGAKLVEDATDILDELGFAPPPRVGATKRVSSDPLLACLPAGEPLDLDQIADRSGLTTAKLLPRLLELELLGFVRRAGGGRFVRFDSPC